MNSAADRIALNGRTRGSFVPGVVHNANATRARTRSATAAPVQGILQRQCACGRHAAGGTCDECKAKEQALQRTSGDAGEAPPIVHDVLRSPGQPLDAATRAFMEPQFGRDFSRVQAQGFAPQAAPGTLAVAPPRDRFEQEAESQAAHVGQPTEGAMPGRGGYDFSQVRIHHGAQAAESARAVDARAYTVGRDIVFGAGQYAPHTAAGRRLLAHELTHVVQQSHGGSAAAVQRDTFTGGPGTTAKDKDRPLTAYAGPMPYTAKPGGTPIPNTAGQGQNCAGDSCSIQKWINWPDLGIEVPKVTLPAGVQGNWPQAINFVPSGCTRVNCSGVDVWSTRCKASELELIAFLYQWPVLVNVGGKSLAGTQSDFHMIGRNAGGLPTGWHSKMDQREKVADIRDPWQSLYDAYPHTMLKDRTKVQLCFCCNQSAIKAA